MKLFLKGARCYMSKCAIEAGRPAPGTRSRFRGRRLSDYGVQLREKQRLRRQYGMQEKQFRLFFDRVARQRGVTGELLLQMLEARLDNVVYRLGFAPSRRAARQLVTHKQVLVNGRKAWVPSMILSPGFTVSIQNRPKSREQVAKNLEAATRELAPWLTVDAKKFSGEFVRVPSREEIAPVVDEQMIVELYSK